VSYWIDIDPWPHVLLMLSKVEPLIERLGLVGLLFALEVCWKSLENMKNVLLKYRLVGAVVTWNIVYMGYL